MGHARLRSRSETAADTFALLGDYEKRRMRAAGDDAEERARARAEAAYNAGRALHELGLTHLAVPCYSACLESEHGPLQREAAHNLSLILRAGGALDLAADVLRRHW